MHGGGGRRVHDAARRRVPSGGTPPRRNRNRDGILLSFGGSFEERLEREFALGVPRRRALQRDAPPKLQRGELERLRRVAVPREVGGERVAPRRRRVEPGRGFGPDATVELVGRFRRFLRRIILRRVRGESSGAAFERLRERDDARDRRVAGPKRAEMARESAPQGRRRPRHVALGGDAERLGCRARLPPKRRRARPRRRARRASLSATPPPPRARARRGGAARRRRAAPPSRPRGPPRRQGRRGGAARGRGASSTSRAGRDRGDRRRTERRNSERRNAEQTTEKTPDSISYRRRRNPSPPRPPPPPTAPPPPRRTRPKTRARREPRRPNTSGRSADPRNHCRTFFCRTRRGEAPGTRRVDTRARRRRGASPLAPPPPETPRRSRPIRRLGERLGGVRELVHASRVAHPGACAAKRGRARVPATPRDSRARIGRAEPERRPRAASCVSRVARSPTPAPGNIRRPTRAPSSSRARREARRRRAPRTPPPRTSSSRWNPRGGPPSRVRPRCRRTFFGFASDFVARTPAPSRARRPTTRRATRATCRTRAPGNSRRRPRHGARSIRRVHRRPRGRGSPRRAPTPGGGAPRKSAGSRGELETPNARPDATSDASSGASANSGV